jgi:hypothetical protein
MALNPRFAAHRIGKAGGHTIDLYLDYVCPYSRKMFDKLYYVSLLSEAALIARKSSQHSKRTILQCASSSVIKSSPGTLRQA